MIHSSTLRSCVFLLSLAFFAGCYSDDGGVLIDAISPAESNGSNSSYARILTVGDFIYAINLNELVTFDATDPSDPTEIDRQTIGDAIETIFQLDGVLLIGSSEGTFT